VGGRARDVLETVLETASFGFDDYLAGVGGDPSLSASSVGLRVPALAGVRYLFLGARADLDPGDAVVGYRQLLTIGFAANGNVDTPNDAPLYPFERPVETPEWHPPDGFVSWHIMGEPKAPAGAWRAGPIDQESFVFEDASTPALLYETATIPSPAAAPGYLGLTAYVPPVMKGTSILTLRDIRTRWDKPAAMRFEIERPTTIRAYAAVLQTNPGTRFSIELTASDFLVNGLAPEDNFAQAFPDYLYWRVAFSLIVERAKRTRRRP
jgi:hypothetical protein